MHRRRNTALLEYFPNPLVRIRRAQGNAVAQEKEVYLQFFVRNGHRGRARKRYVRSFIRGEAGLQRSGTPAAKFAKYMFPLSETSNTLLRSRAAECPQMTYNFVTFFVVSKTHASLASPKVTALQDEEV